MDFPCVYAPLTSIFAQKKDFFRGNRIFLCKKVVNNIMYIHYI